MEEIGARLRAAREEKGISLEVAEEETKIRRKYIEALEEGEVAELPGEVYLKGFLRSYGNYLDLDGAALVEEYKESKNGRRPGSQAAAGEDSAARAAARQERAARRERTPRQAPGPTRTRPDFQRPQLTVLSDSATRRRVTSVMLLLLVVAAIGYLGWLIALQLNPETGSSTPGSTTAGTSGTPADTTAATTPPVTTPPPKSEPVQAPPPKLPDPPKVKMTRGEGEQVVFTVPAKEITLQWELGIKERLWVQWWVDEKEVFQGDAVDARGTVRAPTELKGRSMRLRMGHMRGVSLTINGTRFEKPLESGPYTLIVQAE